jgi:tetratricopeptide (TPR) repeat protein
MFDRKIAKWGFRKNISRGERRDLLLKLPGNGNGPAPESIDRRLKPGKLKNWQRRYNEEELGVPLALVQQGEPQSKSSAGCGEAKLIECVELVPEPDPLLGRDIIEITDLSEPSLESVGERSLGSDFENDGTKDAQMGQEHEEILHWSALNLPGSPKLSRLFKALEIECSKPVPPISLYDTTSDSEEPTCLSDVEMRDLFNENNNGLAVDLVLPRTSSRQQKLLVSLATDSNIQHIHYPWRDIKAVFCGYRSPSPFNEVYVFPPSRTSGRAPKPTVTTYAFLQMETTELEAKFGKLKKQFPTHHAAVIAVMEDLANKCSDLGKDQNAERLYRSLVDVYRRTLGPTNLKTLVACGDVIDTLIFQGRWSEAESLHRNLRSAISKLISPNHDLALWAKMADGRLAWALGQKKRAEILRRELLQIMLGLNGPRHPDTIIAMRDLIDTINQRDTEDAKKLARNTVQLCLENPTEDEQFCRSMSILIDTLYRSSEYVESCSVAKNAIERFSNSLGLDHPDVIEVRIDLAWSLLEAEKLAESEEIFQVLVLRNAEDGEIGNKSTIWSGLAEVLNRQGKVDEAITWHEKSFQATLASCGPCNSSIVNACGNLGFCYENQSRYSDALQLYRNMISSIKDMTRDEDDEQDPNELIAKIERWIRRVERLQKSTNIWNVSR